MEPISPPKNYKVYQLVKRTGLLMQPVGNSGVQSLGLGFYASQQEAEYNRTMEILKDTTVGPKPEYFVFELEVPNPVYKE